MTNSNNPELQEPQEFVDHLTALQQSGLERLVFSGGGAKGVAYSGAYRGLVDTGAMQKIKEIAGSSVGSVVAALVAVGLTPDEVRRVFDNDLTALLGERIGSILGSNPDGTRFFSRSTVNGYSMVRNQIVQSITTYFDGIENKQVLVDEYPGLATILDKFKKTNDEFPVRTEEDGTQLIEYPRITFADLDLLHQIDSVHFKKLLMTATKHPSGALQIFSAETTPDVEIALAVCASCCIPGFFSPVVIPNLANTQWVDGGVYDNMPERYFDRDPSGQYVNNKKANTLLFAFVGGSKTEDNYVFDAIHHQTKPYEKTWKEWFVLDVIMMQLASLKPQFTLFERHKEAYQRMREEYALRTVQLNTASIGPLSFKSATYSSRVLFALGYFDTIMYITNHGLHDQCTYMAFNEQRVCEEVIGHFQNIYRGVLLGAGRDLASDKWLNGLNPDSETGGLTSTLVERLDLIKKKVIEDIDGPIAFAFSRALEVYLGKITMDTLFKETYLESFKLSPSFSVAQVGGETIWKFITLQEKLKEHSMFDSYHQQSKMTPEPRLIRVFSELNKIASFNNYYSEYAQQVDLEAEEAPAYWNMQFIGLVMATLGAAVVAVAFVIASATSLGLFDAALAVAGGLSLTVGFGLFQEACNDIHPEMTLNPSSTFSPAF